MKDNENNKSLNNKSDISDISENTDIMDDPDISGNTDIMNDPDISENTDIMNDPDISENTYNIDNIENKNCSKGSNAASGNISDVPEISENCSDENPNALKASENDPGKDPDTQDTSENGSGENPDAQETPDEEEEKEALINSLCKSVKTSCISILIFLVVAFVLVFITLFFDYTSFLSPEAFTCILLGAICLIISFFIFIYMVKRFDKLCYAKNDKSNLSVVQKNKPLLTRRKILFVVTTSLFALLVLFYAENDLIAREISYNKAVSKMWSGETSLPLFPFKSASYKDAEALLDYWRARDAYKSGDISMANFYISNVELKYERDPDHLAEVKNLKERIAAELPEYERKAEKERLEKEALYEKLEQERKEQEAAVKRIEERNKKSENSKKSKKSGSHSYTPDPDYFFDDDLGYYDDEYYDDFYDEFYDFYDSHGNGFSDYEAAEEYFYENVY